MPIAADALRSARVYLHDLNGISWTDSILMPLLQEAYGEMIQEMINHRVGLLNYQTGTILAPALSTTIALPNNLIEPIEMLEGLNTDPIDRFVLMKRNTFLPTRSPEAMLLDWTWIDGGIQMIGATTNRAVILRYKGTLQVPTLQTDSIPVMGAVSFLGPRIAALASVVTGRDNAALLGLAERNLYKIIQQMVTSDQRPVRKRGYRSRYINVNLSPTGVTSY